MEAKVESLHFKAYTNTQGLDIALLQTLENREHTQCWNKHGVSGQHVYASCIILAVHQTAHSQKRNVQKMKAKIRFTAHKLKFTAFLPFMFQLRKVKQSFSYQDVFLSDKCARYERA